MRRLSFAGGRAAIRIARRDALRHKSRSALVIIMIALPVLALTGADVLARTMQLSTAEKLSREIGRADAQLIVVGGHVSQIGPGTGWSSNGSPALPGSAAYATSEAEVHRLLPRARLLLTVAAGGTVSVPGRLLEGIEIRGIDLREPITNGMARLVSGRFAATPDETAVTPALLKRLHVPVGADVDLAGIHFRIVGVVEAPDAVRADMAFVLPQAEPVHGDAAQPSLLVDNGGPVTWPDVLALNAHGVVAQSRSVIEHPPPGVQMTDSSALAGRARTLGVATIAVGLAVLEVVLLAGAAFAVGARRQRRDLALVAATGGDESHVRRIVLSGGLVLGALGAVAGVIGGVLVAKLAIPLATRLGDSAPGHFDVRPLELFAIAAIGVGTGLAAAVVPARAAARDEVVAALTGRRGVVATPRRTPVTGVALIVLGAVTAAYAAHPPVRFTLVLVGAVGAEIGFVLCAPAIVGALGRVARAFPLTMRLALRDASRHRGRTGPAVAAVLAAVAGSISVSAWITSMLAHDRAAYQPMLRVGQTGVQVLSDPSRPAPGTPVITAAIRRDLPVTSLTELRTTQCFNDGACTLAFVKPINVRCPAGRAACGVDIGSGGLAVGDTSVLDALLGHHDAAAATALAQNRVIVFSPGLARGGHAVLTVQHMGSTSSDEAHDVTLPSYVVDVGRRGAATVGIVSASTATRLHVAPQRWGWLLTTTHRPTQAEQDAAQSDLVKYSANVLVERGYQPKRWNYGLLALAGAAALITLGATGIATALSAADSRPDLVTLGAVGAAPRLRRRFAAGQAATVAVLGTVLGALAGLLPAWAIVKAHGSMPFAMPWETVGIVVVVVPVIAAVASGALTRSKLPSERRTA